MRGSNSGHAEDNDKQQDGVLWELKRSIERGTLSYKEVEEVSSAHGVDINAPMDESGNTLCHLLFSSEGDESKSSPTSILQIVIVLCRYKKLNLDFTKKNHEDKTPLQVFLADQCINDETLFTLTKMTSEFLEIAEELEQLILADDDSLSKLFDTKNHDIKTSSFSPFIDTPPNSDFTIEQLLSWIKSKLIITAYFMQKGIFKDEKSYQEIIKKLVNYYHEKLKSELAFTDGDKAKLENPEVFTDNRRGLARMSENFINQFWRNSTCDFKQKMSFITWLWEESYNFIILSDLAREFDNKHQSENALQHCHLHKRNPRHFRYLVDYVDLAWGNDLAHYCLEDFLEEFDEVIANSDLIDKSLKPMHEESLRNSVATPSKTDLQQVWDNLTIIFFIKIWTDEKTTLAEKHQQLHDCQRWRYHKINNSTLIKSGALYESLVARSMDDDIFNKPLAALVSQACEEALEKIPEEETQGENAKLSEKSIAILKDFTQFYQKFFIDEGRQFSIEPMFAEKGVLQLYDEKAKNHEELSEAINTIRQSQFQTKLS